MKPPSSLFLKLFLAFTLIGAVIFAVPFGMSSPQHVVLHVPYVPQVFNDNWVAPWDEACEEASALMVEAFYEGTLSVPEKTARTRMEKIFAWEDQTFNTNQDTDAAQTMQMIARHTSFRASVKHNPTVEDIQHELSKQHPVIALVNMYQLYQEPPAGDSYHVLVITGYDQQAMTFQVNDPARKNQRSYPENVLMEALYDFNPATAEADGTPTVLFTSP